VTGLRTLAAGIGFTEGPLWTSDGALLVTSMSRGLVYRVALDGSAPAVAAETGGGPNGLAEGADRVVFVAQNGNATIQSRSPRPVVPGIQALRGSEVADLAGGCLAPNDCAMGPDGHLWFTDPPARAGGRARVCRLDPATAAVEVLLETDGFPNGLAFDADGTLVVVDTHRHALVRYRVDERGLVADGLLAEVPGSGPDGIAFDADGRLHVAAFDSEEVLVVGPGGAVEERIPLAGLRPTNLCFAGPGLATLVVTCASGGRVVALERRVRGSRPAYSAA
jgi:gluconolactonase